MLGKHSMFKLFVAVAVAASIAVVGARAAKASEPPYNPHAYVHGGSSQEVSQAIQASGYEGVRFVTAAGNLKRARAHRSLITDTLGGNGGQLALSRGGSRNEMQ
jgi:hypothetical protein